MFAIHHGGARPPPRGHSSRLRQWRAVRTAVSKGSTTARVACLRDLWCVPTWEVAMAVCTRSRRPGSIVLGRATGVGCHIRARLRPACTHSPLTRKPPAGATPPPHTHTPPCSAPRARSADRMVGRGRSLACWASPRRRERKGGSDQGAPFHGPAPCYDARVALLVKLSPGSPTLVYSLQSWGL